MPIIAIAPCSKPHDYEEPPRRAGGDVRVSIARCDKPADVVASADGLLLPGGGDVLPSLYGEAAHPSFDAAETGTRRRTSSSWCAARLDADLPLLGHLPRHSGPERRARRNARAAHSRASRARRSNHDAARAAARDRARCLGHRGQPARSLMRDDSKATTLRRSTAGITRRLRDAGRRTGRHGDGARRRDRSRSRIHRSASASACSGTRKTSTAPASSGPCSKGSSKAASETTR